MAGGAFSVPIFFIVFRETLEAAIIISVLLGLVEQIVRDDSAEGGARVFITEKERHHATHGTLPELQQTSSTSDSSSADDDAQMQSRKLVRKLRIQVSGHFQASRRLAFVAAKKSISPTNRWAFLGFI